MNRGIAAAVVRFAALCGFLVVPSVVSAQLKCQDSDTTQIRRVTFEGNVTFGDDELEDHVIATATDVTRRWTLGWLGTERCIRPGLLAADVNRLKTFYAEQGFREAKVDTGGTTSSADGREVSVRFRIQEGEPDIVDSVSIIGLQSLDLGDDLIAKLNAQKGRRYSSALGQADVDTIQARMRNAAHPLGVVLLDIPPIVDHRISVTLTAIPGPPIRIGKVTVTSSGIDGRRSALDSQVVRDILQFREGDPYRERALIESERQFYRVGNFLSAEVTPDTSRARAAGMIDVTVTALEDLMHTFSVEPGFGTLDCLRARADYSNKAFLHGLNKFEASGQVSKVGWADSRGGTLHDFCGKLGGLGDDRVSSSVVNYNATVKVTRPMTLRGGLLPSASLYTERRGAYKAYLRTTLLGGAVSLSKNVTRTVFWQANYNLEYGRTTADESVLCFFFRACDASSREQADTSRDKRLAVLGTSLARDRRDHPDSTTRGTLMRLDLRSAQPGWGSDVSLSFNKAVADIAAYQKIFAGVVAVRFRGGSVGGGSQTLVGGRLPPPQERLYTGGETSVRGFPQNELGPLIYVAEDTVGLPEARACLSPSPPPTCAGFSLTEPLQALAVRTIPLGGNAMFVANFEYRLRGPILPNLQTILFVDVGRLWTYGDTLNPPKSRWTPGIAFRYFSPIGPFQVNIGYNDYAPVSGPVYFDTGVGTGELVCLSGESPPGSKNCLAASPRRRATSFLSRLKFSVAFPPDF